MKMKINMEIQQDSAFLNKECDEQDALFVLEKKWRESLPRLSDSEWLELFPEARSILPDKIKEWDAEKKWLVGIAKKALRESMSENALEIRLAVQVFVMPRINAAEKHIARLQRQIWHSSSHPVTGRITEADIRRAREVPIASLVSSNLRRSGKTITAKCPLHDDRSPSFVIYPETNSCWCFGCQRGGDSISFTRLLLNLSFIEAVKYLQRI
jgi:hypothetical protein